MTNLTTEQVTGIMAQHAAAVGKVGSGKTYTAKGFVEQVAAAGRRVCVLDPTGAWWGLRSSADGKKAGLPFVIFGGEHGDVPINEHTGAAVAKLIAEKNILAVVDVSGMMLSERKRFVTHFAETLFQLNRAPLHFVIDEADEFCPQNPQRGDEVMLNRIDRIVRRGRSRGFRVFMITQRPAVLHKNVLTQLNTLVALRLTSPQDRKAIQAWIEGNADAGEAVKVMKTLPSLPVGEGWVWSPEHDILIRQRFPRIKTFDSSRTPGDDEKITAPTKLADVDLAEIRESFAAIESEPTIEQLQARIRELERAPKQQAGMMSREDVDELLGRAEGIYALGLKDLATDLVAVIRPIEEQCAALRRVIDSRVNGDLKTVAGRRVAVLKAATSQPRTFVASTSLDRGDVVTIKDGHAARIGSSGSSALPKGERAILIACAQTRGGADRTQLSILTGQKRSTRDAYIQRLMSKGMVSQDHGTLFATAEGFAALGDYERLPTGRALFEYWRERLPQGEGEILQFLMMAGRRSTPRDEITAALKFKRSTRDAYLQRLAARKLIEVSSEGVRAADMLFD